MTSRCRSRELRRLAYAALLLLGLGCSAQSTQDPMGQGGSSAQSTSGGSGAEAGNLALSGSMNADPPTYARQCDGPNDLKCKQVDCPADSSPSTTSVSGKVYDPAGRVPLYNAIVYVIEPSTLEPLSTGAACEMCSAHFPQEGVLAYAATKPDGSFTVTDMPAGDNIPLVIQIGKWRRVITIDHVEPCTNTVLDDPQKTRLPRNSTEGDLPHIAVTTGHADALECLLKKVGIDESEFTNDSGDGHVHLYSGYHAAKEMQKGGDLVPLTPAEELWADSDKMLEYDMMLLGCEGEDNLWNTPDDDQFPDDATPRPVSMHLEVRKYADLGGRIFGSHYGHRWINSDDVTPDDPYDLVAIFSKSAGQVQAGGDPGVVTVTVDNSFPKGVAFEEWLFNVKASPVPGELPLTEAEHTVDSVVEGVAQRWIYGTDQHSEHEPDMVQYFSFTTPVGEPECGRMVFSDVHVSFGGNELGEVPFPERCEVTLNSELSPQEKALEFMLFDLSSCIQKETDEPPMPVTIVK
jgi:hypothetical protein